ncbi:cbb3-type cytochrome oxidase subunit 3 [Bradyrhizobium sp.]|uniref:cbb3-type cytochrome oxidase subunit 3 n=1 Tax=Bradyrhizobium sp. TaxID=376 RepID=UPI001EC7E9BA|nr:cbb3-type cytochrome c oxidase subunit 3 [Bradyrhizobium sp.]MBV8917205.1 cbb3-type cytochrome c oxidase subunit 3 [Bradyrhizobium sp.]MBV9985465.1 cbb3-type cytochrome c oxidase subunit 3 [Bradyrhizobium sp.]
MNAILIVHNTASYLVTTVWTPVFVAIFALIVAYALWPRNKAAFDEAAKMPLRED